MARRRRGHIPGSAASSAASGPVGSGRESRRDNRGCVITAPSGARADRVEEGRAVRRQGWRQGRRPAFPRRRFRAGRLVEAAMEWSSGRRRPHAPGQQRAERVRQILNDR
jgi:hypothetical protein